MPRTTITRDKTGGAAKKFKPGETNTNIEVKVTHDSKVNIRGHEQIIWETGAGLKGLHKSTKVSGQGNLNPIGYIHSSQNTCFLVTRLDTRNHTIQIDKIGKVNAGVHNFG